MYYRIFSRTQVANSKQSNAKNVARIVITCVYKMIQYANSKIWLYQQPIDFRKQIDGLVTLLSGQLEQNPISGQLFIFRSRKGDRVKMLFWDRNGFWLLYKRLEKGRFKFPCIQNNQCELTRDQVNWLLSGLNIFEHQSLPSVNAEHFY